MTDDEGEYGDYATPEPGTPAWHVPLNDTFDAVEADLRALRERVRALDGGGPTPTATPDPTPSPTPTPEPTATSTPTGDVPVADAPANGVWAHGWYHDLETNRPGEYASAIEPVVEALGSPRVVGNTVGKGQNGWAFLGGSWSPIVTRTKPTAETQWDHTWIHHPLIPYGDGDDPAPDTVRGAAGDGLIEQRAEILGRAADGEFDDRYRQFGQVLADANMADRTIVRLAPEFNGIGDGDGWQPAAAIDNEERYAAAFRRFAESVWSVAPETLIGFSPSITHSKAIAEAAFPGEEYVDYLAFSGIHDRGYGTGYAQEAEITGEDCDFPDCSESANREIAAHAWDYYRTNEFGLDAAAAFADRHDLPMGMPEWGLDTNKDHSALGRDNPYFVRRFHDWAVEHNVHWQTYFEARYYDGAFLEGPAFPDAIDAYQSTFAGGTGTDWIARYRDTIDFGARPT